MNSIPCTIVVLGTDLPRGQQWLRDQFPDAARHAATLLLRRSGGELDSVLWAEELRNDAFRAGFRLSIGIAERTRTMSIREAVASATRAFRRARELGSDITLSHSALVAA